jgi:hypothetical protein
VTAPQVTDVEPAAVAPTQATAGAAPGGGGGGGAPAVGLVAPTVTFGDGRTPGFIGAEAPAGITGVIPHAPLTPPAAIGAPDRVIPALAPEVMPPTTVLSEADARGPEFIDQMWAPLRPAFPGGLVFGLAGLLVGPLAGVWLGYRQARAAAAVDQLADR